MVGVNLIVVIVVIVSIVTMSTVRSEDDVIKEEESSKRAPKCQKFEDCPKQYKSCVSVSIYFDMTMDYMSIFI